MPAIVVGSRVAYSVQWLRSTGQAHSAIAHARGVVVRLAVWAEITLAEVDWGDDSIPPRVAVCNLAVVGANRKFCSCD